MIVTLLNYRVSIAALIVQAAIAQSVVKHRVCDRKVADSRFDSRAANASLRPWEKHFTPISYRSQAIYPLWWLSLTKDLQTEPTKQKYSTLVWLHRRRMFGIHERTNSIEKNNDLKINATSYHEMQFRN